MVNKRKKGIIFPLEAYNDRYNHKGLFIFPFWEKLIEELRKYFDITVYNGKTQYPKYIYDKKAYTKIKYRIKNGNYWSEILKTKRFDFILQHYIHPYLAKEFLDKTFVLTDTCAESTLKAKNITIDKKLKSLIEFEYNYLSNVKHIFTYSETLKNFMIKDDIFKDKISVTSPGSFLEQDEDYSKNYNNKIILFVGNPFVDKGGPYLISAFRKIKKLVPDAKLILVSNIPNKYLEILPKDVIVIKNITYKHRKKLIELYKLASVFVILGKKANYPNTIIEAMSFKVPVIATNMIGATEEILSGDCGIIIRDKDIVGSLVKNVVFLFKHPDKLRELGLKGYQRYKNNYSFDSFVSKIVKTIKEKIY